MANIIRNRALYIVLEPEFGAHVERYRVITDDQTGEVLVRQDLHPVTLAVGNWPGEDFEPICGQALTAALADASAKTQRVDELEVVVQAQADSMTALQGQLAERDSTIAAQQTQLTDNAATIALMQTQVSEQEAQIAAQAQRIAELEAQLPGA